jgi:hypothetical protein
MFHYKFDSFFVCELLIGLFAVMVVFHTVLLAMLGDSQPPLSDSGYLVLEMASFRAVFTSILLFVYLCFRLTGQKIGVVLGAIALISWVAFLEDFMVLENAFYMPELLSGKVLQFLRPIYLITIVYMVIEARRREMNL